MLKEEISLLIKGFQRFLWKLAKDKRLTEYGKKKKGLATLQLAAAAQTRIVVLLDGRVIHSSYSEKKRRGVYSRAAEACLAITASISSVTTCC
jgi:hypothetical protein